MQLVVMDSDSLVPENHFLRRIDKPVNFDFIYEKLAPYYSKTGRPSIDPVCMIKMLIVGYLYGTKLNADLKKKIPDHSLFSQSHRRRFADSSVFVDIFDQKSYSVKEVFQIPKSPIQNGVVNSLVAS